MINRPESNMSFFIFTGNYIGKNKRIMASENVILTNQQKWPVKWL
jgi:hypothetical protein